MCLEDVFHSGFYKFTSNTFAAKQSNMLVYAFMGDIFMCSLYMWWEIENKEQTACVYRGIFYGSLITVSAPLHQIPLRLRKAKYACFYECTCKFMFSLYMLYEVDLLTLYVKNIEITYILPFMQLRCSTFYANEIRIFIICCIWILSVCNKHMHTYPEMHVKNQALKTQYIHNHSKFSIYVQCYWISISFYLEIM